MEIYILRHGIAEEAAPGMKDSDRALTSEGAAKLETVLRRARISIVRSREKAKVICVVLG